MTTSGSVTYVLFQTRTIPTFHCVHVKAKNLYPEMKISWGTASLLKIERLMRAFKRKCQDPHTFSSIAFLTAMGCPLIESIAFVPYQLHMESQVLYASKKTPLNPLVFAPFVHEKGIKVQRLKLSAWSQECGVKKIKDENLRRAIRSILVDLLLDPLMSRVAITFKNNDGVRVTRIWSKNVH